VGYAGGRYYYQEVVLSDDVNEGPPLFKRPIWFRSEHLTWLDQRVAELREAERAAGQEITQISRSEVLRRLLDEKIAA
jgi:hypothetical protein